MKTILACALVAAQATDLKLTWSDCGDADTHTKISSFTPDTLTLGQKTTMVGTGALDEDVTGATFELEMTGALGKLLSCSGDASVSKSCNLPLGTGALTFEAMSFPLKAGQSAVTVDIQLAASLPGGLAKTTTVTKSTATNGDKLFCMQIESAPAAEVAPAPDTALKLTWSDCGDADTHTKISSFTPDSLTLGQKTTMVGTGALDEDVTGATFDLQMTGALGKLLSCSGDASVSKTCNLPLGTGALTFEAMSFPLKSGQSAVTVDIQLAASLPAGLAKTTTVTKSTATNGDKLFCMQIKSAPAAEVAPAPATALKLTWSDCGDADTHTKISSFTPDSLTLGQKTTMVGTGALDEDVTGATFELEMTGALGKLLSCSGDASVSKSCNLPLGTGALTFEAMSFPLKAGQSAVTVDIQLAASLPGGLAKTTTVTKSTATNGDKLFCMQIESAPAAESIEVVV